MAMKTAVGVLGIVVLAGCSGEAREGGSGSPSTAASTGGASGAPDQSGSGGEETASAGGETGSGGAETGSGGTNAGTGGTTGTDAGTHVDPTAIDHIDDNLARLRALDVFEVGNFVTPSGSYCATPCADSIWPKAATALEDFANTAENAVQHPNFSYACTANIDTNLATLRALGIVEIGAILVAEPANNPQCYNTPCQSDRDAASAKNTLRAQLLESIAWATETPAP